LDRRTDRPDGLGGGSPTVVTSRATGDDVIGEEQDAQPSDIMSPPRQSARKPTAANSAQGSSAPAKAAPPDDAVSDGTLGAGPAANGAPAAGNGIDGTKDASANGGKDAVSHGSPAAADATIADGIPALPADTIGASRGSRPKESDRDWETAPSKAAEQSSADDSPAFSFGAPPSAVAWPASAAADPAESAAKPSGDDTSPTAPSGTVPSGTGPSLTAPSGRTSPNVSAAPAEPPSVSPAAFAWEMPDPPPNSPSSPARTFLRSGTTEKAAAVATAASSANPGKTEAAKTAAGEGPVTMRNTPQKGKSKRSARQAHLTIARVEPWSVMKFSFVVSLVAFVILFVAVSVLYGVLSQLGVFDSLQRVVASITSSQGSAGVNAKAWFSASKVLGYTALLGSLNIVLITAISTIGSVVYNLTSRLVGGVEVTLRETE
jgi:Transmembrane domain of unknown function (DUF3566)